MGRERQEGEAAAIYRLTICNNAETGSERGAGVCSSDLQFQSAGSQSETATEKWEVKLEGSVCVGGGGGGSCSSLQWQANLGSQSETMGSERQRWGCSSLQL